MTTPKYGGLLTDIGAAALIAASEAGKKWQPTHMLIGDAGGAPGETAAPIPSAAQTKLIRQRYRAQLNRLFVSEQSANVLVAELVLPMAIGGFWIREIGLEDADGKFVAVANCPPSFKASVESGSARTQTIRVQIILSGMEHVELIIDDGIVYATQDWVTAKVAADFKGRKVLAGSGLVGGGDLSADRTIALPASGVGAGTYRAVTVNANGIVTAGSNPTTLGGYGITDALHASEAVTTPAANKLLRLNAAGLLPASITGNAATASRLAAPITLSASGDATWSARFDGATNVNGVLTLANSGVTAGTYAKVTVNAKGLVTGATGLVASDIPALDAGKITSGILPAARGGTGNGIGQAATAVKLAAPRTIYLGGDASGSTTFDGSSNAGITVTLANSGVNAGSYPKVTVNAKGLVTGGSGLTAADIPPLDASKITSGEMDALRLPKSVRGVVTYAGTALDPNITTLPLILTNHQNGPVAERFFYIQSMFYPTETGNVAQIATQYAGGNNVAEMYIRFAYTQPVAVNPANRAWTRWVRCDIGGAFAKDADGRLGDALNLNSFVSSGWWYQTANLYAANGANYPTPKAGRLIVHRADGDFIYQTYQTHDGASFYRCCYSGTWHPWRRLWTDADLNWSTLPGKPATFPPTAHIHDASQITSGILPLARGGLGANNATTARSNIGAGTIATASLGASGWWRDNDTGYIRQWGRVTVPGDGTAAITFPIAFPNVCLGGFAGQTANFHPGTDASTSFYNPSTTGATLENGYQFQAVLLWEAFGR